jgi:hypothetical protein
MTSQGKHLGYPKGSHNGGSDFRREVTKPQNKGIPREAPYKKSSYHGADSPKLKVGDRRGRPVEGDLVSHVFSAEASVRDQLLVRPTASFGLP